MGGSVAFAIGDVFLYPSYSIIGFREVWFESTEIGVVVQAMVRDRKTCLPTVDSLAVECHWLQFIRATRGRVLFPFGEMVEDQLLLFPVSTAKLIYFCFSWRAKFLGSSDNLEFFFFFLTLIYFFICSSNNCKCGMFS